MPTAGSSAAQQSMAALCSAAQRRLGHLAQTLAHTETCAGGTAVSTGRCVVRLPPGQSPPGNRIDGPDIPPPTYQVVPRLAAGSPESRDYLNEHGYVVIASVLSDAEVHTPPNTPPPLSLCVRARARVLLHVRCPAQVAAAVNLAWDFVEQCEPGGSLTRTDPASWSPSWPSNCTGSTQHVFVL